MSEQLLLTKTIGMLRLPGEGTAIEMAVLAKRAEINNAIATGIGTLAIIGPCAVDNNESLLLNESQQLHELQEETGAITLARRAIWKPRSKDDTWKGLHTTDPEVAYRIVSNNAQFYGNNAIEIGEDEHMKIYGEKASFVWTGARTTDFDFKLKIAKCDLSLPLGIKNAMDGTYDSELRQVNLINKIREEYSGSGQAIIIIRGGEKIKTPDQVRDVIREIHYITGGKWILDLAHGIEIACHPKGESKKSVEGQIASKELILELAEQENIIPLGIMMEASDLVPTSEERQVDPNMEYHIALNSLKQLAAISKQVANQENSVAV